MRILALTSEAARHMAFASRILESFDNVAIGIEPKSTAPVRRKTLMRTVRASLPRVKGKIVNRLYSSIYRGMVAKFWSDKHTVERSYFGEIADQKARDVQRHSLFHVEASERISSRQYIDKIRDYRPDVILVMGTSLLSKRIIRLAETAALNLHTGLSPYYRGANTNFWPLLQERAEYCGVTIHGLTAGIDSGGIVTQARPPITPDDTFFSINCKCIEQGIQAIVDSTRRLASGPLNYVPQWQEGNLYLGRQLNARKIKQYYDLVNDGSISDYVDRNTRGQVEAPKIVEL